MANISKEQKQQNFIDIIITIRSNNFGIKTDELVDELRMGKRTLWRYLDILRSEYIIYQDGIHWFFDYYEAEQQNNEYYYGCNRRCLGCRELTMTSISIPCDAAITLCTSCPLSECSDALGNPCKLLIKEVRREKCEARTTERNALLAQLNTINYPCLIAKIKAKTGLDQNQVHSLIKRGILISGGASTGYEYGRQRRRAVVILGVKDIG